MSTPNPETLNALLRIVNNDESFPTEHDDEDQEEDLGKLDFSMFGTPPAPESTPFQAPVSVYPSLTLVQHLRLRELQDQDFSTLSEEEKVECGTLVDISTNHNNENNQQQGFPMFGDGSSSSSYNTRDQRTNLTTRDRTRAKKYEKVLANKTLSKITADATSLPRWLSEVAYALLYSLGLLSQIEPCEDVNFDFIHHMYRRPQLKCARY